MTLGEAIKHIRLKCGLSQEQLCKRAQLTQGFYSGIENGRSVPSLQALQRIADALEIPMFFLIWLSTDRSKLPKKNRVWYENLNPVVTSIIDDITNRK